MDYENEMKDDICPSPQNLTTSTTLLFFFASHFHLFPWVVKLGVDLHTG